jgi:AcrR family transcriptional regulator
MGIKERQFRDRETVRRAIMDAARELFVTEGFHNVSIRKIAERIEYSPPAIYSYFPSKDDIFFALAEEGFRLLCDAGAVARGAADPAPSLERVRGVFERLYEFSRDHPQYFALMFVDRSVPRISREYERFAFAREMKGNIVREIASCVEAGLLPDSIDPAAAMRLLMIGVVGRRRAADRPLHPGHGHADGPGPGGGGSGDGWADRVNAHRARVAGCGGRRARARGGDRNRGTAPGGGGERGPDRSASGADP